MVLIRADANERIGAGHVMRCLSIARSFAEKGRKVIFATADHRADGLIQQADFESVCLNSDWRMMEEEKIEDVIKKYKPECVLVDSYYVTKEYINHISSLAPIAYMDDMNAETWDVDYLINYNIFSSVIDYSNYRTTRTRLILGPTYAPLRQEFQRLPERKIKESVSDVFVSAGGADPERITEKLMTEICLRWRDVQFHFVVGALNPRLEEIKKLVRKNVVLHINEKHMADLMMQCDIAISAAGSTLYELCATGTPTITYTLADNQLIAAEQFEKQGLMLNAGDCREERDFIKQIEYSFQKLSENVVLRSSLSIKMQQLVDGQGAERIAEKLMQK